MRAKLQKNRCPIWLSVVCEQHTLKVFKNLEGVLFITLLTENRIFEVQIFAESLFVKFCAA